jgi:hypothetical protein
MDNKEDTNKIYHNNTIREDEPENLAHCDPSTDRYVFKQIYNITQGDKTHV